MERRLNSVVVGARFTPAQVAELKKRAGEKGMSDFVRAAVIKELGVDDDGFYLDGLFAEFKEKMKRRMKRENGGVK